MLQFITKQSPKWSLIQQAEAALQGGCRWIQIAGSSVDDDINTRKATIKDLIPTCRDHEAFLIVEDDVDLVENLHIHGVFLRDNSRTNVMAARERLGAEAVIGVGVSTEQEIISLKGLDIDYLIIKSPEDVTNPDDIEQFYANLIDSLHKQGIDFHFVAEEDTNAQLLPRLIAKGCAGVAVSSLIADADNIAEATHSLLTLLDAARIKAESTDPDSVDL